MADETEIEGGSVIIRGQGPLISEGVYGQGPILEAVPVEVVLQRKRADRAAKAAEAEAAKTAEEAKVAEAKAAAEQSAEPGPPHEHRG